VNNFDINLSAPTVEHILIV